MISVPSGFRAQVTFNRGWWGLISSTRIFVESFCSHTAAQGDLSERVSMVCHELLQNAWLHAATPDSLITCSVSLEDRAVRITVENPATPDEVESLQEEIAAISRGDAFEVYVQKMKQSLSPTNPGRLGLARIRYEGRAALALETAPGKVIVEAKLER